MQTKAFNWIKGSRSRIVGFSLVTAIVAGSAGWAVHGITEHSCGADTKLRVVAAPELADAMGQAAEQWSAGDDEPCVSVTVTAMSPARMAARMVQPYGRELGGAPVDADVPEEVDVWVPDSSVWLHLLRIPGLTSVAPRLAHGPIMLAVNQTTAKSLGWNAAALGWPAILAAFAEPRGPKLGIAGPDRDAASLLWLSAVRREAMGMPGDPRSLLAAVWLASVDRAGSGEGLLAGLAARDAPFAAAPLPEAAILAHKATEPGLTAVPLRTASGLDCPYVVLSERQEVREHAAGLLKALQGEAFLGRLPAGIHRPADTTASRRPESSPANPPSETEILNTLSSWTTVTRPGRILAVIDISGSMNLPVPGTGRSRHQVATAAALKGLERLDGRWAAGLWVFSTALDGQADHRAVQPVAPLTAEHRLNLRHALTSLTPSDGDTGLYDTVLAAYRQARADRESAASPAATAVVVLTDGYNDDSTGGLTWHDLRAALAAERGSADLFLLGIGPEASEQELSGIAAAAGGTSQMVRDPADIDDIFLAALASRLPKA